MLYKRATKVPWRIVEEKAVLVSVGNSEVMVLNEVGSSIWAFLDQKHSQDEITEHIFNQFDADRGDVERDVTEFLKNMKEKEVLDVE